MEFTLLVGRRRGTSVVTHGMATVQSEEHLGVYLRLAETTQSLP